MQKKGLVGLLVLILVFSILLPHAYAPCESSGQTDTTVGGEGLGPPGESTPAKCNTPQDFQQAINDGQSATFNAGNGETFEYQGKTFKGKGEITFQNGKLSGEFVEINEGTIDEVEGMEFGQNNDFTIKQVKRIAINGDIIINGKGIRYKNGHLKADEFDLFLKGTIRTTNGIQLDSILNKFSIEKADRVESDCVIIPGVIQSNFTNYANALEIQTSKGINLTIDDCSNNPYDVTFESNGGKVIVNKEDPAKYIVEKGTLTCSFGNKQADILIANQTASLSLNKDCFECVTIEPVGTYWHRTDFVPKDFGIQIPQDSSSYTLCLKREADTPLKDHDGLIDFTKNRISITKIANYLRMPFAFNSDETYYLFKPYVPVPIYQGKSFTTNTTLMMDKKLLNIDSIHIGASSPDELNAIIRFGHNTLIETPGGRLLNISPDTFYPRIIKNYTTNLDNSSILFNRTLYQQGNNKVKIPFINSAEVNLAEQYLQNYWNRAARIPLIDFLNN
jgi:hypothetical protein